MRRLSRMPKSRAERGTSKTTRRWEIWRRGSGSNRRIKVLQTSPLPLGYRALLEQSPSVEGRHATKNLERETGVEPATSTLARSRSTTELLPLTCGLLLII